MLRLLILTLIFTSCSSNSKKWYRGNTHAHTKLSGHGDATPEEVTKWYHDRGYNFLVISEHNKFIDPNKIKMPSPLRDNFILIPGVEVSGNHVVHTTAFNVREVIPAKLKTEHAREVLQFHVDGTLKAKGTPIANHPNFAYALSADDIASVKKLSFMELYNAHPLVNHHGDHKHPGVEEIWDDLLTRGKKIYALASDDAHYFHTNDPKKSIPGFGWIMVKTKELETKAILSALEDGDFYASSGVILRDVNRNNNNNYFVEVDQQETLKVLGVSSQALKIYIHFIGENGKVLKEVSSATASFDLKNLKSKYLRARIKISLNGKDYFAWTMPYYNH